MEHHPLRKYIGRHQIVSRAVNELKLLTIRIIGAEKPITIAFNCQKVRVSESFTDSLTI
jgi:hypothetical protein